MTETLQNNTIRIALLGKTGAGKSALGNTILGRRAFKSFASSESRQRVCRMETAELPSGQLIQVVDDPGFIQTTDRDVIHEMTKAIEYLSPGPHAFLLVLQPNRATPEEINSLTELNNLFGDDSYLNNTIIIMVRRNEIVNEDESLMDIHKYVLTMTPKVVQELYRKCGRRIIAVDNKERTHALNEKFRKELVDMIMQFPGYYTLEYLPTILKKKERNDSIEKLGGRQTRETQQITETLENESEKFDRRIETIQDLIKEKNKKKCVLS